MGSSATRLCASAVLPFALCSCVTTAAEGEAMRSDIDRLKTEVAEQQKRDQDLREDLKVRLGVHESRLQELEGTLAQLRQSDADVSVQMEKVIAELQQLRGDVEEARFQLGETKKSVQDILERPPVSVSAAESAPRVEAPAADLLEGVPVPAAATELYELGKKLFEEQKYDGSIAAFDLFTTRHADDKELIDNAWFWKGEAHYARAAKLEDKKLQTDAYRQAVLAYQRVLQQPSANKADGALFKIGLSFEALGFPGEAKVFYEELLQKHPKSALASSARKRLKALKAPRGKKPR